MLCCALRAYTIQERRRLVVDVSGGCRTLVMFKGAGVDFSLRSTSMRNPLRRYYGRGDLHFFTFSCYRRWPLLGTAHARNRFVTLLDRVRSQHRFPLIGYVVMPEHVHLVMSEPEIGNPSKALQVLKQNVSRALRRRPKTQGLSYVYRFPTGTSGPHSGSGVSMISMCGARENSKRSWITCTGIRCNGNLSCIRRIGHGAVGRTTRRENAD